MYGDVFPSTCYNNSSDTISRVEPFSPLACYRLREPRMLHKATNGHSPSEAEQSVLSRTWNSLTTSVSWLPSQSLPFCMRTQRTWCVRGVCGVCEDHGEFNVLVFSYCSLALTAEDRKCVSTIPSTIRTWSTSTILVELFPHSASRDFLLLLFKRTLIVFCGSGCLVRAALREPWLSFL